MYWVLILLLVSTVLTQQELCTCRCCRGQSCTPISVGTTNLSSCIQSTCLARCHTDFRCQLDYPNGIVSAECSTSPPIVNGIFRCQCSCCSTGSTLCTPSVIGESTAFVCSPSACSLSCNTQYPNQCVDNDKGLTDGTCIGPVTTTTTATPGSSSANNSSWLGNACSCMCCKSGPDCSPTIAVGLTTTSDCSSAGCTQACQTQYPFDCPTLSYLGRSNGICTNQNGGSRRCQCQCSGSNGYLTHQLNIIGACTLCDTACRQQSQCTNPTSVTATCDSNQSIRMSVSSVVFIMAIVSTIFCIFAK